LNRILIEDASKPAPMMRELVRRLAEPDPYGGSTDPEYRRAVDACLAAFSEPLVEVEELEPRDGRARYAA
jgi:hypothetical protein